MREVSLAVSQHWRWHSMGPFALSVSANTVSTLQMVPTTLLSLNAKESLQNGLQPHYGATPLFSITSVIAALTLCWRSMQTGPPKTWFCTNEQYLRYSGYQTVSGSGAGDWSGRRRPRVARGTPAGSACARSCPPCRWPCWDPPGCLTARRTLHWISSCRDPARSTVWFCSLTPHIALVVLPEYI